MDDDARRPRIHDLLPADDPLVREEEERAREEARRIGGSAPDDELDEARRPVEEAGGGEAEGFEQAERELVEQATHEDNLWDPEVNAPDPELESDRATAEYGEADDFREADTQD